MSTNPENTHTSPETCERDAQVERYDAYPYYDGHQDLVKWDLSEDGSWVKHSNFESVRQERDRLRAALEKSAMSLDEAAATFKEYALLHAAKGPDGLQKAMANAQKELIAHTAAEAARAALNQSDAQ